jgi:protein-L-isoaspartate(D-aspartate) O-methyltransferase
MHSEELRRHMIDSQLRTSGVNEPWVLRAMGGLLREKFVADARSAAVYTDRPVVLENGRALNPPVVTGLMLQKANPSADDHVLLIGAGSGYLATLIADRVASLTAVENDSVLANELRQNCPSVQVVEGPLNEGDASGSPYTLLIIDGAIDALPDVLADQLAEGGRVVTGLRDGAASRLAAGVKHGTHLALRSFADAEIALLPGFERTKEFVF